MIAWILEDLFPAIKIDSQLTFNSPIITWNFGLQGDVLKSVWMMLFQKVEFCLKAWNLAQVFIHFLRDLFVFSVSRVFRLYLLIKDFSRNAFQQIYKSFWPYIFNNIPYFRIAQINIPQSFENGHCLCEFLLIIDKNAFYNLLAVFEIKLNLYFGQKPIPMKNRLLHFVLPFHMVAKKI